jgi:hypothetical protein
MPTPEQGPKSRVSRMRDAAYIEQVLPKALTSVVLLGSLAFVCVAACGKEEAPPPKEPSGGCQTTGSRECKETNDCGGGMHCTGGRCFANQQGCPCTSEDDCGATAHCTKGSCYANAAGVPCTKPTDCGSKAHCTTGNCYANGSGSPCSEQSDCGAGSSCVSGTCN